MISCYPFASNLTVGGEGEGKGGGNMANKNTRNLTLTFI
jgi:hypothetical protein